MLERTNGQDKRGQRKADFGPKCKKNVPRTRKIKISKIRLRHVLSWPKPGLEPKFHDPGTFGGVGKHGQTDRQD